MYSKHILSIIIYYTTHKWSLYIEYTFKCSGSNRTPNIDYVHSSKHKDSSMQPWAEDRVWIWLSWSPIIYQTVLINYLYKVLKCIHSYEQMTSFLISMKDARAAQMVNAVCTCMGNVILLQVYQATHSHIPLSPPTILTYFDLLENNIWSHTMLPHTLLPEPGYKLEQCRKRYHTCTNVQSHIL